MVVPLPDETEVQCNAYEHALGWSAVGETGGAIVVGAISGSAYIFPGDQTDNFTPEMPHQIIPPAHTVTKGTGGEWTGSPAYASSETTFTDSGADFQAYMVGWGREATAPQERNVFRGIQADVELPSYLEIVEVVSATAIKVKGDADTLATSGSTYRLHAPPGVSATTGALITGLEEAGSRWLWAGYEYMPPMVGFHNPEGQDPGTYGAQPGTNKVGSYHCWNRVYEPQTGRWTTTDPAMMPWDNLFSCAGSRPTQSSDPSGLAIITSEDTIDGMVPAPSIWDLPGLDPQMAAVIALLVAADEARVAEKPLVHSGLPVHVDKGQPSATYDRVDSTGNLSECKLVSAEFDPDYTFSGTIGGIWEHEFVQTSDWYDSAEAIKRAIGDNEGLLAAQESAAQALQTRYNNELVRMGGARGSLTYAARWAFGIAKDIFKLFIRGTFTFTGKAHYKCECPDETITVPFSTKVAVNDAFIAFTRERTLVRVEYKMFFIPSDE